MSCLFSRGRAALTSPPPAKKHHTQQQTFYDPNNRNFVIVTGNVGREPRFTTVTPRQQRPGQPPPEPVSLMTFSVGLAVPGRRPSGGAGAGQSSPSSSSSATDWLPVKAWGEVADAARGRVHRGTLLVVSGTLRTEPEPPSQQQQQGGGGGAVGGGEDGYQQQQQQRARAYIHAKSIGIVTRRPSSAADALAMGGAGGGDMAAAAPSPDYPAAAAAAPPLQQQQQQQYASPPPPAAASATPSPTAAAAVGGPPADRAAACEALWRDWAQTGGEGWFDNRQRKRSGQGNARQPDFRRKAGAPAAFAGTPFEKLDALWIDSPTTPAWVMESL